MAPELDMGDDFGAVAARAAANGLRGCHLPAPGDVPCARRIACNRLFIRRWAARRMRPGESWGYLDTLGLVDAELARMGVPAGESGGCGCYACHACNPPVCACGGTCPIPG